MQKDNKGYLYLIPSPINDNDEDFLSAKQQEKIKHIKNFVVENLKPARNTLKKINLVTKLQDLNLLENNKQIKIDLNVFMSIIKNGDDFGLLSDCGLPCMADPGSDIVSYCHENNIIIKSLCYSSSITTSLISSGFNGQNFEFIGYLPINENEKNKYLEKCYKTIQQRKKTFIFIESPHRNNSVVDPIIKNAPEFIRLCIAYNIGGEDEFIRSYSIKDWKNREIILDKKPCIFLIN